MIVTTITLGTIYYAWRKYERLFKPRGYWGKMLADTISVDDNGQTQPSLNGAKDSSTTPPTSEPLTLLHIKGIGKTFAHRLQTAGVHTLSDLMQLSAPEIQAIVSPQYPEKATKVASWLEQAHQLMAPKQVVLG